MQSIKDILQSKKDVKAGTITYGEYIGLRMAINDTKEEVQIIQDVINVLHGDTLIKPKDYLNEALSIYIKEIAEGLRFWLQQENDKLDITPTSEQIRAGIKEYSEKIGVSGTIYADRKSVV